MGTYRRPSSEATAPVRRVAIASVVAVFGAARSLLGRRPASEAAFRTIAEQETVHKKLRSGTRWLRIGVAVAVLATLTTVATPVSAADGDLDTSFDSDGMRKVDLHASGEDGIYHIAVEDDGDVMFSGYWNNNGQANKYSWYQQLKNPDGTSAGLSNPNDRLFWSPKTDVIRETLIQSDGRYVSVGYAGTVTTGGGGDFLRERETVRDVQRFQQRLLHFGGVAVGRKDRCRRLGA